MKYTTKVLIKKIHSENSNPKKFSFRDIFRMISYISKTDIKIYNQKYRNIGDYNFITNGFDTLYFLTPKDLILNIVEASKTQFYKDNSVIKRHVANFLFERIHRLILSKSKPNEYIELLKLLDVDDLIRCLNLAIHFNENKRKDRATVKDVIENYNKVKKIFNENSKKIFEINFIKFIIFEFVIKFNTYFLEILKNLSKNYLHEITKFLLQQRSFLTGEYQNSIEFYRSNFSLDNVMILSDDEICYNYNRSTEKLEFIKFLFDNYKNFCICLSFSEKPKYANSFDEFVFITNE